jgi:glutathione S-transferase
MNRFTKERLVRPAWGFEPDIAFIESAKEPLALQVGLIEESVERHHFLAGNALTLADCFLLPHLLFFGRTEEGEALLNSAPAVRDWLARMIARPSFEKSPMRAFTFFSTRSRHPLE